MFALRVHCHEEMHQYCFYPYSYVGNILSNILTEPFFMRRFVFRELARRLFSFQVPSHPVYCQTGGVGSDRPGGLQPGDQR